MNCTWQMAHHCAGAVLISAVPDAVRCRAACVRVRLHRRSRASQAQDSLRGILPVLLFVFGFQQRGAHV